MICWYDHLAAKIGLRIAGIFLLISAWPEGLLLRRLVLARPEISACDFLLGLLLFLSKR